MRSEIVRYLSKREASLTLAVILGVSAFILGILSLTAPHAFASHSASCSDTIAPPSGYCVTSDFHGTPVPVGTTVNVTAYTTDSTITRVRFIWNAPDGTTPFDEIDTTGSVAPSGATGFSSIHTVGIVGDWGVRAIFCTGSGSAPATCPANSAKSNDTEAIRATSFEGIPEFQLAAPLMGSITLALWMLLKRLKNKQ